MNSEDFGKEYKARSDCSVRSSFILLPPFLFANYGDSVLFQGKQLLPFSFLLPYKTGATLEFGPLRAIVSPILTRKPVMGS